MNKYKRLLKKVKILLSEDVLTSVELSDGVSVEFSGDELADGTELLEVYSADKEVSDMLEDGTYQTQEGVEFTLVDGIVKFESDSENQESADSEEDDAGEGEVDLEEHDDSEMQDDDEVEMQIEPMMVVESISTVLDLLGTEGDEPMNQDTKAEVLGILTSIRDAAQAMIDEDSEMEDREDDEVQMMSDRLSAIEAEQAELIEALTAHAAVLEKVSKEPAVTKSQELSSNKPNKTKSRAAQILNS